MIGAERVVGRVVDPTEFTLRVGPYRTFWTKQEDGGALVTLHRHVAGSRGRAISVEVLDPVTHAVQHFGSLRQFWRSLGKAAPVSVRRYTGRGKGVESVGLLKSMLDTGPKLGIDLAARGHEVRKLMWAGYRDKILRAGYDPEDVLQEVYRGLIARNNGKCPWDVRKSSFGHYVHMVIGCVLINYHRKQQQVRGGGAEVSGLKGADGVYVDAAGCAVAPAVVAVDATLSVALVAELPVGLRAAGAVVVGVLADGGSHREAMRAAGLKVVEFEVLLAMLQGCALPH